jgi:hypothetical protein
MLYFDLGSSDTEGCAHIINYVLIHEVLRQ